MEVYIEWTYLLNGLVIFLSLEILFFLLNQAIHMKKLLFYMALLNISVLLLYVNLFTGFVLIYDLFISLILFRKLTYIYYPLYVFIYVSLVSFIHLMMKESIIFQGVLLVNGLSLSAVIMVSVIFIIFVFFYLSYCREKIRYEFVEVSLHDRKCMGFIDNGNHVTYQGCPVIFMKEQYIQEEYIDIIEIDVINHQQFIYLVKVKDIRINHHVLHDIYVGILYDCEYECILNNQLLGGLL